MGRDSYITEPEENIKVSNKLTPVEMIWYKLNTCVSLSDTLSKKQFARVIRRGIMSSIHQFVSKVRIKLVFIGASFLVISCSQSSITETAEVSPESGAVNGDRLVRVQWKQCVPHGTFPGDTYPSNTDENGCRHNTADITVWPTEEGKVRVAWLRSRMGAYLRGPTKGYSLVIYSRGCDPDGPGVEGYYDGDEVTLIDADWADGREIIEIEDLTISLAPTQEADSVVQSPLLFKSSCEYIDLDNDYY